jgi:hypothetical protein
MSTDKYKHVNAYEVNRAYGGPEEGGWWYDFGRPLGSILVEDNKDEIKAAKEKLKAIFGPAYENNRTRFSVLGEDNLEIYVQDHPAATFPSERPHYE